MIGRTAALGALAGVLAIAATALAAPAAGSYRGMSGFEFAFKVARGRCPTPPDPNDPSAAHGPEKRGLCFETNADPPIEMTCPAPASISGEQAALSSLTGLRLSASGALLAKSYTYEGQTIVGDTELSLKIRGRRASGWVETTEQVSDATTTLTCDSGKLQFTAKRA